MVDTAKNRLQIAVMGAGAVGCYYGGMLARAGHEVTLVGRRALVEAVRGNGLRLEHGSFDLSVPVRGAEEASGVRGAKLVLFSVKSQDTEMAGKAMAPYLERDTAILSLQNGVDNAERLAATLGREVIGGCVYVASEMAGPGHVKRNGRGELVIGRAAASERIAAAFQSAEVPVEVSDNIAGMLWTKIIMNCAYNALSAITQLPYGRLVASEGIPALMAAIVDECIAVSRGAGVSIPGELHAAARRIAETMPAQFSSTAQDLARGKPTEIEHLNGFVAAKGEALGVPAPLNRMLVALVKAMERSRSSPGLVRGGTDA
jgi:2-dehydropantoate 2-reductase